ncbi:hypothetical protein M011DRAFT_172222 [Sporormia fimetaria CBS 119925]|uniref:Uncharacterized protein n=1 Tax=Sporormia fimetaria CBS 119925 TaxID=1340428 RepID=A0A6A6V4Z6_9PLEO|nr:hypothetical protein M011DRAFT_172222 [Sporormia fimetaria CBS 119925]
MEMWLDPSNASIRPLDGIGQSFEHRGPDDHDRSLYNWYLAQMYRMLDHICLPISPGYLAYLAKIASGDLPLQEKVSMLFLEMAHYYQPWLISSLNQLDGMQETGAEFSTELFRRIAPQVCASFRLIHCAEVFRSPVFGRATPIRGEELVQFVDHCLREGMLPSVLQALGMFLFDAQHFQPSDYDDMVLPFLVQLPATLSNYGVSHDSAPDLIRALYQTCLSHYLQVYVGPQPVAPHSWAKPAVDCLYKKSRPEHDDCAECADLNDFLQDSEVHLSGWVVAPMEYTHIKDTIRAANSEVDCTETKKYRQKLVLKIQKSHSAFEGSLSSWETRREWAAQRLGQFDQPILREILGVTFDAIMNMQSIMTQQPPPLGHLCPWRILRNIAL